MAIGRAFWMTNQPYNNEFTTREQMNDVATKANDVIDLYAILSTLWRGKWIIGIVTVAAVLIGGYYAYVAATPLFRAASVVILETERDNIVDLQSVVSGMSGETSQVNSEVEVLRSRGLMEKVVDRLNLVDDPEFNGSLREPSKAQSLKNTVKGYLGLKPARMPLSDEEREKRERASVVSNLLLSVSIRNIPSSLVFEISAETENANKSALIADTIAEIYVIDQLEVKYEATEQATSWLSDRVSELQVELEQAEQGLSEFSSSTELVSTDALQALEIQLKELRDRIDNTEEAQALSVQRLDQMRLAETRAIQAELANDPQLLRYLASNEPRMLDAFDLRFEQLVDRAELELNRSQQQLAALKRSESELAEQMSAQSADLITLQQLTRETEATRTLYEYFLTRLKETAAQHGIQKADSRILSRAVPSIQPNSPQKALILGISLMLGLLFGAALVLLNEARKTGFRTARDLERHSGLTVLGQIPQFPVRNRKKVLPYLSEKAASAGAEAIRNLRTSVLLSNVDSSPKLIMCTSAIPGEGKTTNTLALAQNLAGLGKSVLVIEGDIRRRTFTQHFGSLPKKGIVSVLAKDITLQEAVHSEQGIDVLVGEKTSVNAADVFSSESFKNLLQDVRQKYDIVIIDTPPVLVVPDARVIAQYADAVLFMVKWDSTSQQQVDEALRLFKNSNQRITGLVLTQINPRRMKAYGYGGKYGAYAGYGSKYYVN